MVDAFELLVARTFDDFGDKLDAEVINYLTDSLRDVSDIEWPSAKEDLR